MRIIIILVFLALCSSCGKNVTIKGKVYNPVTNLGIENIQVIITRQKINLIPGSQDGVGSKTIASTTTDANGNYSFSFKKNKNRTYYMYFLNDDELYYRVESEMKFLESNSSQTIDYKLISKGNLEENKHNTACYDENDLLSIKYMQLNIQDYYENKYLNYKGCYFHDGNFNSVPMGWYKYEGTVTKNGLTTPIKDSIYVTAGGYHTWNIVY